MSRPTTIHDLNDQTGSNDVNRMSIKELERWLTSDDLECARWRTSMASADAVTTALDLYATARGAGERYAFQQRLAKDRQLLEEARRKEGRQESQEAKLKDAARERWLAGGGDERSFDTAWDGLKRDLLKSGEAADLIREQDAKRRAKAAKTF